MGNTILQPGIYYHIYNRGTNGEVLFKTDDYYKEFLQLYTKYITPVVDTLAYCLMSNHFHFLIRTKEEFEIKTFNELKMFEADKINKNPDKKPTASPQFAHLFNTYSKKINKAYQRTGSLFEHPFERRMIESELYLRNCIAYIHFNPLKDGFAKSFEDYKWSSYKAILSEKTTLIERQFVIDLFGGKDQFLIYHEKDPETFREFKGEFQKTFLSPQTRIQTSKRT